MSLRVTKAQNKGMFFVKLYRLGELLTKTNNAACECNNWKEILYDTCWSVHPDMQMNRRACAFLEFLRLGKLILYRIKLTQWRQHIITHSLSSSFRSWKAPLSIVVILFSINCLREKHQESVRLCELDNKKRNDMRGGKESDRETQSVRADRVICVMKP